MPTKNNINYKYYKQFPKTDFEKNPWTIDRITRGNNDIEYINLEARDNKKISNLELQDYRSRPCDYDKYGKLLKHPTFYDNQNVNPGYVGKCTVDTDSRITRGRIEPLPNDKLSEIDIQFSYTPLTQYASENIVSELKYNYKVNDQLKENKFLLSTMPAKKIQQNYKPGFDIAGKNTRNYGRSDEVLFKRKYNPYQQKTLSKYDPRLQKYN